MDLEIVCSAASVLLCFQLPCGYNKNIKMIQYTKRNYDATVVVVVVVVFIICDSSCRYFVG